MTTAARPLIYESPLNERMRLFLRLEFLFEQAAFHRKEASRWNRRQYLLALLDILQLLSRSDIRTEVSKELGDLILKLERLMDHPDVDAQRLGTTLDAMRGLDQALQPLQAQFASNLLRDCDFLTSLLNRSTIPGGTASFDMPALHLWLFRPDDVQERQIQHWSRHLTLFEQSIAFTLRMLRQTGELRDIQAESGNFSMNLGANHNTSNIQLLRVIVPVDNPVFPEICASRHRCSIRFLTLIGNDLETAPITDTVHFRLALCGL